MIDEVSKSVRTIAQRRHQIIVHGEKQKTGSQCIGNKIFLKKGIFDRRNVARTRATEISPASTTMFQLKSMGSSLTHNVKLFV